MLCVKQWEIWLQNCKMDTKSNAMHVNPKHKWCMKKSLVKYLKTENFSVSIDRASIKYQSCQADSNKKFKRIFDRSIENLENSNFWKTEHFNVETSQSTLFYEWNASVWDEKFFKNPWIQPRSSKNKIFNQFLFKAQTLKHILHQNQWTFNLGWPQQVHT